MLAGRSEQPLWLAIDRTNWKFGKTPHNLLVISAQVGDTSVPLVWKALDKSGNSNGEERISLMQTLLGFLDKSRIKGVLADREFIGENWFGWLQEQGIPFITRVKGNMIATLEDGGTIALDRLFSGLREGGCSDLITARLGKLTVQLQAKRTAKGLVIVACHRMEPTGENDPQPVNLYRKRWTIECAFACLKRKGFNLEDTHLLHAERLETLMAIVVIAFTIMLNIGMVLPEPPRKKHGYHANCRFTIGKQILTYAANSAEKLLNTITSPFRNPSVNKTVV